MNFLFFTGGVIFFGMFLYLLIHFLKKKLKGQEKFSRLFSYIGFLYLFFSVTSILWSFDFLIYYLEDFLFLYAVILISQTLIFFRIVYLLSQNKILFYLLGFYLMAIVSFLFIVENFLVYSVFASILFNLLLCFEFVFSTKNFRKIGYFGIIYSVISLVLNLFLESGKGSYYLFYLISFILFFIFLFFFLKVLDNHPLQKVLKPRKEKSYLLSLLGHLVFVITLTNFIFIGTIGIHEFGHYSVSKFYDCDYRKIVYEGDLFHTEILCGDLPTNLWVTLGGVLAPIIIALFLFLLGGKFMKEVAVLMVGFNLISVSRDFGNLGISENLIFFVLFFGSFCIIYGLYKLIKSRTEEDIYFYEILRGSKILNANNSPKNIWRKEAKKEGVFSA